MKKICLLFVLSIVSVFSISAQTEYKPTDNTTLTKTELESAETSGINSEIPLSEEEKILINGSIYPAITSLIITGKRSLGEFSTGNPEIDGYIEESSALYNIDPLLIYAQMNQESRFKIKATSGKGASGLMQLIPDTAKRFGVKNIYNPEQNIKGGVKYMRWLLDRFDGDVRLALAAYNAGEGAVKKYGNKIPPYRETENYVARIMAHYERITTQISSSSETSENKTNKIIAKTF